MNDQETLKITEALALIAKLRQAGKEGTGMPKSVSYHITWEIDIDAESPREAAKTAQKWMDEADTKWVFTVEHPDTKEKVVVDLNEDEDVGDEHG